MIDFVCDGCHAALQIADKSAGLLGRCPYCGTNTRVPGNPKRTPSGPSSSEWPSSLSWSWLFGG